MRKISFVLVALFLLVTTVACGTSSNKQSSQSSSTKQDNQTSQEKTSAGKTLVVDLVADPVSLDPGQVTDINSNRVHFNMYDTLVGWDEKGFNMVGKLAKSWKISDDEKTYTFKLRQGVTFTDGSPLNANAVKFTFERMLDKNNPYHNTGPFPFASSYYGEVSKISTPDQYTVQFELKHKYAPFLNNLTATVGGIVNPAAVKKYGKDFALHGGGSGAFMLENWQKGVKLTLKANKNYWNGAPKVDRVVFQPVTEDLVRVTKLKTGEADIIADVNPDSIPSLSKSNKFNVLEQAGPHVWYVGLNLSQKPFDNLKVRQAVNYAVDKQAIVKDILNNTGVAATQVLSPVFHGYNSKVKGYPYNPEKAKKLLAEAGYPNGFTVEFLIPQSGSGMQSPVPMATAIQGYLKNVGITAKIKKMEWGAFLNEINQGAKDKHDMWSLSWMTVTGDADMPLTDLLSSKHIPLFNSGYYKNDQVTNLLEQAASITDEQKRTEIYQQVEEITTKEAPWIFVDWAKQTAAASAKVTGFHLHPSHMFDLSKVSK